MVKQGDNREDLINDLCIYAIKHGIDAREAKNDLYIILNKYEITSRCTELAELKEDRNETLVKKFIISKMVKGCTERTIEFYSNTMKFVLNKIDKAVDDITSDDIRLYIALRKRRDMVCDTTIDNELESAKELLCVFDS